MTPHEIASKVLAVAQRFTLGMLVWHRASGRRAVVVGFQVREQGEVVVTVDYGQGGAFDEERPLALSAVKVLPDGDEDEIWKGN